jgi:hypothetical protein
MYILKDEEKIYTLFVWLLSILLALIVSSVILFIDPSFPIVILLVQIFEIFLFAQIFICVKRINNALRIDNVETVELYDLETRSRIPNRLRDLVRANRDD